MNEAETETTSAKVDHSYSDFSDVAPADDEEGKRKKGTELNFPAKLHEILSRSDLSEIITWMPHGRSWRVLQPQVFVDVVAPKYYAHTKYSSFTRQVTGWGFKRLTRSGPDCNSYYHELFLRGKAHLVKRMKRPPSQMGKLLPDPENEPNFWEMSRDHPLPEKPSFLPPPVASLPPDALSQRTRPSSPPTNEEVSSSEVDTAPMMAAETKKVDTFSSVDGKRSAQHFVVASEPTLFQTEPRSSSTELPQPQQHPLSQQGEKGIIQEQLQQQQLQNHNQNQLQQQLHVLQHLQQRLQHQQRLHRHQNQQQHRQQQVHQQQQIHERKAPPLSPQQVQSPPHPWASSFQATEEPRIVKTMNHPQQQQMTAANDVVHGAVNDCMQQHTQPGSDIGRLSSGTNSENEHRKAVINDGLQQGQKTQTISGYQEATLQAKTEQRLQHLQEMLLMQQRLLAAQKECATSMASSARQQGPTPEQQLDLNAFHQSQETAHGTSFGDGVASRAKLLEQHPISKDMQLQNGRIIPSDLQRTLHQEKAKSHQNLLQAESGTCRLSAGQLGLLPSLGGGLRNERCDVESQSSFSSASRRASFFSSNDSNSPSDVSLHGPRQVQPCSENRNNPALAETTESNLLFLGARAPWDTHMQDGTSLDRGGDSVFLPSRDDLDDLWEGDMVDSAETGSSSGRHSSSGGQSGLSNKDEDSGPSNDGSSCSLFDG